MILLLAAGIVSVFSFFVKSLLMFWVILELQLFMVAAGISRLSYAATQVYFCVNAFGGILMLIGGMVSVVGGEMDNDHAMSLFSPVGGENASYSNHWSALFVFVGLILKLGMFPLPSWVRLVSGNLWKLGMFFFGALWFLVMSKVVPLIGMFHFLSQGVGVVGIFLANLFMSGWGLAVSKNLGELVSWASIGSVPLWVILGWGKDFLALTAFSLYSVILLLIIWMDTFRGWKCLFLVLIVMPPLLFFLVKGIVVSYIGSIGYWILCFPFCVYNLIMYWYWNSMNLHES